MTRLDQLTPITRIELKRADVAELVKKDAMLSACPFVGALGPTAEAVLRSGTALRYPATAALFQQGQPGHSVFFVLRGDVRLVTHPDPDTDDDIELGQVLAGQFIGEAEVLEGGAMRTFSAIAVDVAEVVEFSRASLTSTQGVLAVGLKRLFEQSRAQRRASFDELTAFFNRW